MMRAVSSPKFALKPLLLVLSGLAISHPLAAETRLAPVVVEATADTRPNATVIDQQAREALMPASSNSAGYLLNVPGVSLNTAGGVSSQPVIHGLADDRVNVLIDGVPRIASCPNHMNPPLSYIDPAHIEQLLVYTGVTPVSVGGNSLGGTVVVESKVPRFATGSERLLNGEVGLFYRSNNNHAGTSLAFNYGSQHISIAYHGAYSHANNYHAADHFKTTTQTGRPNHQLARDEVGSSAFETQNHRLRLAYQRGADQLGLTLSYQNMPEQGFPNQRMDLTDNHQRSANLYWNRATDWGEWQARVYHEHVDHAMDFGEDKRFWYGMASNQPQPGSACGASSARCASGMPMISDSKTTGVSASATIDLSASQLLTMGAEYNRYRLDDYWQPSGGRMWPNTFQNINQGKRDRSALFAEWDQTHGEQWSSQLGLRYQHLTTDAGDVHGYQSIAPAPGNQIADAAAFNAASRKQTDHSIDLTALAQYDYSDQLDILFGFARKERSPSLYQRYTWSSWPMAAAMNNTAGDGNAYLGNLNLKPETAHTVSVSVDMHAPDRSWQVKATPYYTRIQNYIDVAAVGPWSADRFNRLQYVNQSARLYGLDLSGDWTLGRNALGQWRLSGLINYIDAVNRHTGSTLHHIMPLNARLVLNQQYQHWDNSLELIAVDRKNEVSHLRNEQPTAGYMQVNLHSSYRWQPFKISVGIENVLNRHYQQPNGGAYLGQGSTMMLNGPAADRVVPGMGRTVYGAVTMTF